MENNQSSFPLEKQNYLIIIAGVVITLLGFVFMAGGGSDDPNVFNEEELFSPVRIRFAPFMVILGYIIVLVGIMKKTKVNG
jgi:Na+/H+ antiporter NhaC